MSWLAVWLIGAACADLTHSVRPVRWLPGVAGAALALLAGLAAGLTGGIDLAAVLVLALLVVAWDAAVRHGFGTGRVAVPLTLWGGMLALLLLVAGEAGPVTGAVADWQAASPLPGMAHLAPEMLWLGLGVVLVQLSTGNVLVRLVLTGTGTVNPAAGHDAGRTLKGGRLLGPMERLLILGLGLAGQLTAAGLVVAAKGLLRWPEIQATRASDAPGVDELTEYFLLGSFVSWLCALGGLALLAA